MEEKIGVLQEKTKEKSHIGFLIKMAIFLVLIYAKNVLDAPISATMLLVVSGLIALTGRKEEIVALVVCCIPLATSFQYKYLQLLCIVIYCIKARKNTGSIICVMPLLFMMIWEALHAFGENFLLNEYLRSFAELIAVTVIMLDSKKEFNYVLICRIMAASTLVMCFVVLMNLLKSTGYNFEGIFTGTYRFGVVDEGTEFFGVSYNANNLGFICNLSIAGLLQLVASRRQRTYDYIMIVALMFFGFLTMSRAFVICCALIIILFMLAKGNGVSDILKAVISVSIIIGVIYFIISKYAPFIIERIIGRFEANDITNGRAFLFTFYNSHLMSNPKYLFFGIGLQDVIEKIQKLYGNTLLNVPHNGIQELLVVWGAPGLIMFVVFILNLIKHSNEKHKLINYIPMLMVLLYVQSSQLITNGSVLLSLTFIYLSLCENFGGVKNEDIQENCEVC